jgi:predicted enzyme related to lactoylglutathione lyase
MPTAEAVIPNSAAKSAPARRPHNAVWFELPVTDLPRAVSFYEAIFSTQLKTDARFPGLAIFPRPVDDAVTGALIEITAGSNLTGKASTDGAIVYLNCDGQLDMVLKRAQSLGGKVLEEVAQLPGSMGFIAQIRDLDGNRVGLHAAF